MITVVILPGMDGTGMELTDFVAALAPELEAIVVTYPNDRPMDYAGHEVVARASLPIDRPFVLLGESYSGPIAISIAASAPPGDHRRPASSDEPRPARARPPLRPHSQTSLYHFPDRCPRMRSAREIKKALTLRH